MGFQITWKKLLTQMQMAQFVAILIHSLYHLYVNIFVSWQGPRTGWQAYLMGKDTYWPSHLSYVELFLMILMLAMFSDFYLSAYNKKKADAKAIADAKSKSN
jgi:hypothetical protein